MADPTLVYPQVKLTLTPASGSSSIDVTPWVRSLRWSDSSEQLNSMSVTLVVPEADDLGDDTLDDFQTMVFLPGGSFKLEFYEHPTGSTPSTTLAIDPAPTGDIVSVRHGLTVDGRWTVALTGLESLHRLKGINITSVPDGTATVEVADLIAECGEEVKATGKLEGKSYAEDTPIILDQSKLALLKQIADRSNQRIVWDPEAKQIALKDRDPSEDVTVTWGFDLKEINMTLDLSQVATAVEVMGLQPLGKEDLNVNITAVKLTRQSSDFLGTDLRKSAFGANKVTEQSWGQAWPVGFPNTKDNLMTRANAVMQNLSDKFVMGSLSCLGKLKASQDCTVTVAEAPWPYKGTFVISDVTHTYSPDDGITTEITFYSNSLAAKT
ncbi:MAG: hypothetical protein H6739_34910 [Alphaproteobacteria bacterium]|nr:hypothetical protein [Alphaproteobacteria bacterium]